MIRFQRINGVELSNSNGLPSIHRTPEGIAMGAVPGWSMMVDPDYADPLNLTVRNRARPNTLGTADALPMGEFPNGQTSFSPRTGSSMLLVPYGDINPYAWSGWMVVHPISHTITQRLMYAYGNDAEAVMPHLGISATGENILMLTYGRNNDNPVRLSATGRNLAGRDSPTLVMWTFSTRDGTRIFDNGEMVASNPDDKRPLEQGYASGEWRMFANARGEFGMAGLLNIDLGAPENAAHRRSIEQFIRTKYGITNFNI